MSELSHIGTDLDPYSELEAVFAGLQNPELRPPQGVEQFIVKEPHLSRVRRLGRRVTYGKNVAHAKSITGASITTLKPPGYDVDGYTKNVSDALDGLIVEAGEFPDSLYDVAETATAVINQENHRGYSYFEDDPEGVEVVGMLKAIISRPDFIKNPRAEEVLSQLGQAASRVCGENLFTEYRYPRPDIMKDGYDIGSLQDLYRIATSDALWSKAERGGLDPRDRNVIWPLISCANALETLAVNHPTPTQQPRLDMLRKNETAGQLSDVNYHLVYSFNTDEEKAFLAKAAAQDVEQKTGSRIAQAVLDGRYDNWRWA